MYPLSQILLNWRSHIFCGHIVIQFVLFDLLTFDFFNTFFPFIQFSLTMSKLTIYFKMTSSCLLHRFTHLWSTIFRRFFQINRFSPSEELLLSCNIHSHVLVVCINVVTGAEIVNNIYISHSTNDTPNLHEDKNTLVLCCKVGINRDEVTSVSCLILSLLSEVVDDFIIWTHIFNSFNFTFFAK